MPVHEIFMRRCIELALEGAGSVSPNPMVGSLIVVDGKIIAEGYHEKYGSAHAEANAIAEVIKCYPDAENVLNKATLYVNLEPCAHFGKQPPCSDLIIRYSIPRVVVGCRDPFDLVDGKGIEKLRAAGVQVIENVLKAECRHLNRRFFTRVQKQRPYIILKWAQTKDGYFAPADGSQRWISSPLSRKLVHKWRAEEDSVLVGKNTALIDDPELNVRFWSGRDPVRIVIDRDLQLPSSLQLFDQSQKTIVFNSIKTELDGNIKYLQVEDFDKLLPHLICYQLYLMDIQSILIEGGAATINLFVKAGLWDEARIFTADTVWEAGLQAPCLNGTLHSSESVGKDILEIWHNNNSK
jgi:diaminohydroxyphosphoribosylaminopyrimidine deaminase / 5-amino-6-(5-phosphoribosylamino)uracil reductase